ncbi:MAG: alpha/beta hydrolase [Spirochaetes bacterium]|nr:MAG: alpha/beta hydrolase [Spirochaetota bacterium]
MIGKVQGLFEARLVQLRDANLAIYEIGPRTKPPIVLLHGFMTSALTWHAIYPALRNHHRVILVDLPGSGRSRARGARSWTTCSAVAMLIELFDTIALDAPIVVGSQLGGSLAASLAANHPTRVSRLIVIAAGALGEARTNTRLYRTLTLPVLGPLVAWSFPYWIFVRKWAAGYGPDYWPDAVILAAYYEQFCERGAEMARFGLDIRYSYRDSFDEVAGRIAGLDVPTLLIYGTAGGGIPSTTGRRFAKLLPHSSLIFLPGCGAFPQEESPASVVAAILNFLGDAK